MLSVGVPFYPIVIYREVIMDVRRGRVLVAVVVNVFSKKCLWTEKHAGELFIVISGRLTGEGFSFLVNAIELYETYVFNQNASCDTVEHNRFVQFLH